MQPAGRILRRHVLESVAIYRVVEDHGDTVTVEVIEAPGLSPGFRMRLTAADAQAMEELPAAEAELYGRPDPNPFPHPA